MRSFLCSKGIFIHLCILIITCSNVQSQSIHDVLSNEEKIYGLSKIWAEVSTNFVFLDRLDFDFDSLYQATIPKVIDASDNYEYIHVLRKFMDTLNDGHTGIQFNQFYWDEGDYPPVFLKQKEGRYFVTSIDKKYADEIPLGSELLKADGIPYSDYMKASPSGNLFSYVNSTVLLEFISPNGEQIEKELVRNFNQRYRSGNPIEMIEESNKSNNKEWVEYSYSELEGYSLIEINTFKTDTVVKQFRSDISRINNSKGLIVDVRQNGGGNSVYSMGIAQHLVKKDILVGPMWKTRVNNGAKKGWGSLALLGHDNELTRSNEDYWKGNSWEVHAPDTTEISIDIEKVDVPIIILMGNRTFSAAEDFLIYTMGNENIKKIGQPSAGSSGQPIFFELPGGISARVCAKRDTLPNGEDYIGIGIQPDIMIAKEDDALKYAITEMEID